MSLSGRHNRAVFRSQGGGLLTWGQPPMLYIGEDVPELVVGAELDVHQAGRGLTYTLSFAPRADHVIADIENARWSISTGASRTERPYLSNRPFETGFAKPTSRL